MTTDEVAAIEYASAADVARFGEYRVPQGPEDPRPLYRFTGRITADGSSGFRAEPARYHLYAGWFCPWSQRVTIQRALNGLDDVISVSYVDNARDGRGWAFRETYGPDPVNGFGLLRDAYEATEPGFDGHVSVPTLWDRSISRILSNDFATIGLDFATQFGAWASGIDTYPIELRDEIDELDAWIGPIVNHGVAAARGSGAAAQSARRRLLEAFGELDCRLQLNRYLLGDTVTEADIRLWVTLVRYEPVDDLPSSLQSFPHLWAYARDLYRQPAFRATTKFEAFAPGGEPIAEWEAPQRRAELAARR